MEAPERLSHPWLLRPMPEQNIVANGVAEPPAHIGEGNTGGRPRNGDDDNEPDDDGFHALLDRQHPC